MGDNPASKDDLRPAKAEAQPKAEPIAETASAATATKLAANRSSQNDSTGRRASEKVQRAAARKAVEQLQELHQISALDLWIRAVIRAIPSWLVSMVVHTVVLLVLALLTVPPAETDNLQQLVVAPGDLQQLEELEQLDDEPLEELDVVAKEITFEPKIEPEKLEISVAHDMEPSPVAVELSEIGLDQTPSNDLLAPIGAFNGGALSGRGPGKAHLALQAGGTEESEAAVALALQWLAEHQWRDGGWSFNHTLAPECRGQCRNAGQLAEARNAATGLALLPFLGAGQTHKQGRYKETVKKGLYFLVGRMKVGPQGGSLHEEGGRMYAHGIASIALCEAYAMTRDRHLYVPAQQAVYFICYAQDPVGGGWRYDPRPRMGDTSVVGWQIMALKSGHMAYLEVPSITVRKAYMFLDTVQANNGANYGYMEPGSGAATTAIGLLCRMYLGWKKDNPNLERGVNWISDRGPSPNNMYYNYYATQVMRHWGGDLWKKWNHVMREQLVNSQATEGHEKGSWFMPPRLPGEDGDVQRTAHTDRGGRLYCTAMAAMILEVYYRHMPIYRKQSTEEDFPLD